MVDGAVELLSFRMLDVSSSPSLVASWIECEHALSDPAFFPWWRAAVAQRLAKQYAPVPDKALVPEQTTGGYVLPWYLAIPSYVGGLLFHSARRVPSLEPRQLSFRLESAALQEVALRPGRFWCLPGDPDAGHPDAVPVPDEASLGAVLRGEVIAHAVACQRDGTTALPRPRDHLGVCVMVIGSPCLVNQDAPVGGVERAWVGRWRRR
jgi:hypothetical protein